MQRLTEADIERNMRQFYVYCERYTSHPLPRMARQKGTYVPDLSLRERNQLYSEDTYFSNDTVFKVLDYEIVVQDDELADALYQLPEHRRDIILLKYFLKWSDRQIAEVFASYPTTINHRRYAALKALKKIYMENNG